MSKQAPAAPRNDADARTAPAAPRNDADARTAPCGPGLRDAPLDETEAAELAAVFKALGDPIRLRLLSLIAARAGQGGEVCVCELTPAFAVSQPTISHHLKLLRQARLITGQRRGTWVYYRLVPHTTKRIAALLTSGDPAPEG